MESNTGSCTLVYHEALKGEEDIKFERKEVVFKKAFSQGRFKLAKEPNEEDVLETLERIRDEQAKDKLSKRRPKKEENRTEDRQIGQSNTFQDIVNFKRKRMLEFIEGSEKVNFTKISRLCGVAYESVKKFYTHYTTIGVPKKYEYANKHTKEEEDELNKSIDGIQDGFSTVTDLKRLNPSFSRKKILSRLHQRGMRWRKVPRFLKNPPKTQINSRNIIEIIKLLTGAFYHEDVEVLYVDEMKFPLNQTSSSHWTLKDKEDTTLYGNRPLNTTLTAIALCSRSEFVSVMLVETEVRTNDFIYFLQTSIERLANNKQYLIIADNATWHKGKNMSKTGVLRMIRFNEPRQFRLNLIENAFSYIRSVYRKRPQQNSIESEARTIIGIFFDPVCKLRFSGFYRNHVRQLIIMYKKHRILIDT